ncbi:MAG: FkbM family methyltransferase [Proteobacteria bacterium]|nr:FkbM family methyltransferase [Pseudomonadota bacterium]
MSNKYIRSAKALTQFLSVILKRNIIVGREKYSINVVYRNQLLKAVINNSYYEASLDHLFRAIFSIREGAVIDVGANVGQTLIKVLEIEKNRQYIGFEPQTSCCFFIDQFIIDNNLNNHVIMPIGLSDGRGITKLGLRRPNDTTASMIDEYRPGGFYFYHKYIPVISGDEVLLTFELPAISLVKIDVEGAELEVIRGLSLLIKKHKPYIVFEILPNYLFATKTELDEEISEIRKQRHADTEKELRAHGYLIYQIQTDNSLRKIDAIKAARRHVFNYIAVPEEEDNHFADAIRIL